MKTEVANLIESSLKSLVENKDFSDQSLTFTVQIDRTRQKEHGDFSCNIAMQLAKVEKKSPKHLAQQIISEIPASELVDKVELAGPGFINFYLTENAQNNILQVIQSNPESYGSSTIEENSNITVEFVSANPTGPLHVGHGRGASYGDSLSRLLDVAGYQVHKEYYVNDAGRQMDIMALSVWLRYLEEMGNEIEFPENGYQGEYIKDIAAKLAIQYEDELVLITEDFYKELPEDKELRVDEQIARAKKVLGKEKYDQLFDLTLNTQLDQIKEDLKDFGVEYNEWFSEKQLHSNGSIKNAIQKLEDKGYLYEKDGAIWFKSTDFKDEKDRVVQRDNGAYTYFASDIAYLVNKVERGFSKLIYVYGADHHGYIARLKGAFDALGYDSNMIEVLTVQFAILYRNGEKAPMSTRSGQFVTLEDLRDEVGKDAARFFYCMRRAEQHMDFDMDLAKEQSNENPVYYIQYAHARICSILRQSSSDGELDLSSADLNLLQHESEKDLISHLAKYPEIIQSAARQYEPHQVGYYLKDLAALFHSYYNNVKIIEEGQAEEYYQAKLMLIDSTRQVFVNGLNILGVSAPKHM